METIKNYFFSDMDVMLGRSMRHILRSMDTIITVTIMPIAFMLLFVYVFGGAIETGTDKYVNYLLPGILLIAIATGISYTAYRLFIDMQRGILERFHSMPIARSTVLWGHVLTSLVSNAISVAVIILVALITVMACCGRYTRAVYVGPDLDRGDSRTVCKIGGRCKRLFLSHYLTTVYQFGVCAYRVHAGACSRLCRKSACDLDSGDHPRAAFKSADRQ
jgi:hypothetical protein